MISTVSGYSVTLLIAVVFRFLQRQRPIVTWGASIVTVVVAAGLVAFIDAWVFSTQNRGSDTAGLQLFLGAFYLSMTPLGAWSALFYALTFYLDRTIVLSGKRVSVRVRFGVCRYIKKKKNK